MNYLSLNEVKDYAIRFLVDAARNVSDDGQLGKLSSAAFGTISGAVLRFVDYIDRRETEPKNDAMG